MQRYLRPGMAYDLDAAQQRRRNQLRVDHLCFVQTGEPAILEHDAADRHQAIDRFAAERIKRPVALDLFTAAHGLHNAVEVRAGYVRHVGEIALDQGIECFCPPQRTRLLVGPAHARTFGIEHENWRRQSP